MVTDIFDGDGEQKFDVADIGEAGRRSKMEPMTFEKRIEQTIVEGISNLGLESMGHVSRDQIVVLAGNGVTRLAVDLSGKPGQSWDDWLRNSVVSAQSERQYDFQYFRRQWYTSPEIFGWALQKLQDKGDNGKKLWEQLWRLSESAHDRELPLNLHRAIAVLTPKVMTSNYDDLFEQALAENNLSAKTIVWALNAQDEDANWFVETTTNGWQKTEFRDPHVLKVHGGFLTQGVHFEKWAAHAEPWMGQDNTHGSSLGLTSVVASRDQYERVAFADIETFNIYYKPVRKALRRAKILFVVGFGLAAEELIVTRLLTLPEANNLRKIIISVEPRLDPLWRYERLGFDTLIIPLGLVSSPWSRTFALLLALRQLAQSLKLKVERQIGQEIDAFRNLILNPRSASDESWAESSPQVLAIGQASLNRVIGIDTAVAQERAYGPTKMATWSPNENRIRYLANIEAGGQALVPCLVWDALRIPSALTAQVYADDIGNQIVERVMKTNWVDFEWMMLNQRVPESESLEHSSENATVVTWYGLRTIIDSVRSINKAADNKRKEQYKKSNPFDSRVFCCRPPVVYATKVNWEIAQSWLAEASAQDRSYRPLVVYDTGGRGNEGAERWIAAENGIIVSSALAALEWFHGRENALEGEPKDERGRLWQTRRFLIATKPQELPTFLRQGQPLQNLRAYVVTLGEYGTVYWIRRASGWSPAMWSGQKAPLRKENRRHILANLRNGLGCGDVARAGFVASLLASMKYRRAADPQPADQITCWIECAVGWLNWFGGQKVRYFAIDDYVKFIKENCAQIIDRLRCDDVQEGRHNKSREYGPDDFSIAIDFCELSALKIDKRSLDDIIQELNEKLSEDRTKYQEEETEWQDIRFRIPTA